MIDLAHAGTFADHAVLDAHLLLQTAILALQPLHVAAVFERNRGNAGNRRHELEMVFRKTGLGTARVEIDRPKHLAAKDQRNTEYRLDAGCGQTLRAFEAVAVQEAVAQNGDPLAQHVPDNRPDDANSLYGARVSHTARDRGELLAGRGYEQDRAALRR